MKKISVFILFLLMVECSFSFAGDSITLIRGTDTVTLESEFPKGSVILRVGSPIYNLLRNGIRNMRANGEDIGGVGKTILVAENLPGVGPNSLLIFEFGVIGGRGFVKVDDVHSFLTQPHAPGCCGDIKTYLLDQGLGLAEIILEDGLLYPIMGADQVSSVTLQEIVSAVKDPSIVQRFVNSGVSIWDAVKGPGYAAYGVYQEASEGDITRSLKSAIRIPISIFFLGSTIVNKTVRLPIDLVNSGIRKLIDLFSDEEQMSVVILMPEPQVCQLQLQTEEVIGVLAKSVAHLH